MLLSLLFAVILYSVPLFAVCTGPRLRPIKCTGCSDPGHCAVKSVICSGCTDSGLVVKLVDCAEPGLCAVKFTCFSEPGHCAVKFAGRSDPGHCAIKFLVALILFYVPLLVALILELVFSLGSNLITEQANLTESSSNLPCD